MDAAGHQHTMDVEAAPGGAPDGCRRVRGSWMTSGGIGAALGRTDGGAPFCHGLAAMLLPDAVGALQAQEGVARRGITAQTRVVHGTAAAKPVEAGWYDLAPGTALSMGCRNRAGLISDRGMRIARARSDFQNERTRAFFLYRYMYCFFYTVVV